MLNYIFDGSFTGLLTAIYQSYIRREKPCRIISGHEVQESIIDSNIIINSDEFMAEKLITMIRTRISYSALENILYVYLSDSPDGGTIIYKYLDFGWRVGKNLDGYLADDRVLNVYNLCRKVLGERHRMLGLIRFKLLKGNIYYAAMEPTYNITALLVPHFTNRLKNQDWIIHDVKRGVAALYNKTDWIVTQFNMEGSPVLDNDEEYYQKLWKEYYESIAIKTRINKSLQQRNMPKKYWKYLIEKQPGFL